MTDVEKVIQALVNTRKTIQQVCREQEIEYRLLNESPIFKKLEQCSVCSHWRRINQLVQDADGFPTCKVCVEVYDL